MDVYGFPSYLGAGMLFIHFTPFPYLVFYLIQGVLSWREKPTIDSPHRLPIAFIVTELVMVLAIAGMYQMSGDSAGNRFFN